MPRGRKRKAVEETDAPKPRTRHRKASTPEARENQLISLAENLAEQQMRDGTASAQVIVHYLKLGSSKNKLEQERLKHENLLLEAKADAIQSAKHTEELYANALKAMRIYSGQDSTEEEPVDD